MEWIMDSGDFFCHVEERNISSICHVEERNISEILRYALNDKPCHVEERNISEILRCALNDKLYISLFMLLLMIFFTFPMHAMFNDYEPSARARSMSGAVTSVSDDYSAIFYNPAGLKYAATQAGATFYRPFNNDFQTVSAVSGSYESSIGSFGIGYQVMNVEYYDINLTSEQKFSLGHSFYLNKDINTEISLGYSANLYSLSYHELGEESKIGINAGVIAVLHQRTKIGFMLTNINKPEMGKNQKHEIPQMLAVGLSYIPYQGVITAIDLKKNWDGDTELRTGVEVEIYPAFILRMGIRNNPASYSAGVGFKVMGINLDYAINTHAKLSLTHHVALGYKF